MKKRWFVVILTIGLLLCLVPLSAFALNGDCITDSEPPPPPCGYGLR